VLFGRLAEGSSIVAAGTARGYAIARVDFNLQIPANALTFVVLLAMGWVAYSVERRGGEEED